MKKVFLHGKLGSGKFVLVDDEDYQRLHKAKPYMGTKYPYVTINGKPEQVSNFVYGITAEELRKIGKVLDHLDRDKMNAQKNNLELKTVAENNRNRRSWKKGINNE